LSRAFARPPIGRPSQGNGGLAINDPGVIEESKKQGRTVSLLPTNEYEDFVKKEFFGKFKSLAPYFWTKDVGKK
jgi:hypothetical protein